MAITPPRFNPNQPIPNTPFTTLETSYLVGPYFPATIDSSSGLTINSDGTISVTGGGGGGGGTVTNITGTAPISVGGSAAVPNIAISTSTTSALGAVQLATNAEVAAGTNTTKAVTPASLALSYMPKTGGTFTGPVIFSCAITANSTATFTGAVTTTSTVTNCGPVTNCGTTTNVGAVTNCALVTNRSNVITCGTTTNVGAVTNCALVTNCAGTVTNGTSTFCGATSFCNTATFVCPATFCQPVTFCQTPVLPAGTPLGCAACITYNNASSGLTALDVQAAIDELAADAGTPATTTTLGTVCIGSNISVTPAGEISVADGTTTALGVVQLYDGVDSTSTTCALTAAQGKSLQDQITGLTVAGGVELAGTLEGSTGNVVSVTSNGTAAGFAVGSPLPAADATTNNYYVIITNAGTVTPPGGSATAVTQGDWFLVSEATPGVYSWQFLNVGFDAPPASTTVAGIVQLATNLEAQTGTDTVKAVTSAALQSKLSNSISTTSSTTIASSTAVKTAYDLANAAIPKATVTAKGNLIVGTASATVQALAVGANGRILAANSACTTGVEWITNCVGTVTSIATGTGLTGGPITSTGTIALADTAVTAGDYTYACFSVDAQGRLTAAANGPEPVPCSAFTAVGDILGGTGAGTYSVLSLGADGEVLAACSTATNGLCWTVPGAPPDATPTTAGVVKGCTNNTSLNVALGCNALTAVLLGCCNTAIGASAGCSINSGCRNVAIGNSALAGLTSGVDNIAIGHQAGLSTTAGSNSVAIGSSALGACTNVVNTVAIGFSAGVFSCGTENVLVGQCAGTRVGSQGNVYIGACSGFAVGNTTLTGGCNTNIGFLSLQCLRGTAASNVSLGACTSPGLTTGCNNTILGTSAGNITTGSFNVVIGCGASVTTPTGSCQLAIGFSSTCNWLTGNSTKAIKPGAGILDCTNSTGTAGQVLMSDGANAICWGTGGGGGSAATPLIEGTLYGVSQLGLPTACGNTALGYAALVSGCIANAYNTAVGYCTLALSSGTLNVGLGAFTLAGATTASNNTAIGTQAMSANAVTGGQNTAIGASVFNNAAGATGNTGLGWGVASTLTNGTCNVIIGLQAGQGMVNEARNVVIGPNVIPGGGDCVLALGFNTGCHWLTGCSNKNIRPGAGILDCANSAGTAGQVLVSTGANGVVWGVPAAAETQLQGVVFGNTCASDTCPVTLGSTAGGANPAQVNGRCLNTLIGRSAGFRQGCCTGLGGNTMLGAYAGIFSCGCNNILLGAYAGTCLTALQSCNVIIGSDGSVLPPTACGYMALSTPTEGGIGGNSTRMDGTLKLLFNDCGAVAWGPAGSYGVTNEVLISRGPASPPKYCAINCLICIATPTTAGIVQGCTSGGSAFLGVGAGGSFIVSGENVGVGVSAQNAAGGTTFSPSACRNVAIGNFTSQFNVGADNVAVGNRAYCNGANQYTGCRNVALGAAAMTAAAVTGSNNVAIGYNVSLPSPSGSCQLVIGWDAGCSWLTANNAHVFLGFNSGLNINPTTLTNTGCTNVFLGCGAGEGQVGTPMTGGLNVAIGKGALLNNTTGALNIAIGCGALLGGTSGSCNVAIGSGAMRLAAVSSNVTAVGALAGFSSGVVDTVLIGQCAGVFLSGASNVAVGNCALMNDGTVGAQGNVAIGTCALGDGFVGIENVAVGFRALAANSADCGSNVAVGASALAASSTGICNTAVGWNALGNSTSGICNTAVGRGAGQSILTGSHNTLIGAGSNLQNGCGNVILGGVNSSGTYAPAFNVTSESNRVVLGSSSVTQIYAAVNTITVSDARDKIVEGPVPHGLDFIKQLQPVSYHFRLERDSDELHGPRRYGLLAQDVLALEGEDPVIVNTEEEEKLRMAESYLVPVLINAVKELAAEVEALKAKLNEAG